MYKNLFFFIELNIYLCLSLKVHHGFVIGLCRLNEFEFENILDYLHKTYTIVISQKMFLESCSYYFQKYYSAIFCIDFNSKKIKGTNIFFLTSFLSNQMAKIYDTVAYEMYE